MEDLEFKPSLPPPKKNSLVCQEVQSQKGCSSLYPGHSMCENVKAMAQERGMWTNHD